MVFAAQAGRASMRLQHTDCTVAQCAFTTYAGPTRQSLATRCNICDIDIVDTQSRMHQSMLLAVQHSILQLSPAWTKLSWAKEGGGSSEGGCRL